MINELTRKNAHTELDHIFKTILPAHGMTERPEQIRLSHTMLDAMFENRIALSDAGTGIGKTYAYLTAAIVYSHSRSVDGLPFQPVIIATSSIALQNAIVREYLPFLSDALADDPHITTPILAALRKGKSHYVCDERLRQHLQQRPNGKNAAQKRDLYSLRDVLDLDETQKLSGFDRERVCVPQFCDCKHPDCRYRRHLTECGQKRYLFQICNQNLWLADCMHRENGLKPILPDACTIIVDEAHKLPETAREMFGTTLSADEIRSMILRLKQERYVLAADRLFSASSTLLQKMAELSPEYPVELLHDDLSRVLSTLFLIGRKLSAFLEPATKRALEQLTDKVVLFLRPKADAIRYTAEDDDGKLMAKKRVNGEGTIGKRKDGRWEARYVAGRDPETGKQIRKSILGKTQAEVREKLKEALAESAEIDVVKSSGYSVSGWMQTWYSLYAQPNVRETTARYYKRYIDHHVTPRLGDVPLCKLTSLDIQQFYKDLLEHGRIREDTKDKKPGLSSTTVHGIHVMLKSALKRAVQERLIPYNPAEFCIPPKITKPELQVIPSERYQSYLAAAEQRGVLPMFYLELSTGLRKGEIAALLWSDYDAQTKTIHVTKQYLFYNGHGTVSPPKSESSIRYVSIPDEAARLLEQEHEKHPNNPYMFPSPITGEMYHPDAIVKIHRKICKDIGLENVRFHDLRHSFATTALQSGVDVKTVSTMLGHSSAGFTLNVYTHSTSRMQQEAARIVGKVMPKMQER